MCFAANGLTTNKIQPKIISIHPPDRRSFNFYRRAIVRKRDAQCQIEAWLNRMVTLDTHPRLRQIGHDTFPDTFPTEIIENSQVGMRR